MIVDVTHPETGETIKVDMLDFNESRLATLQKEHTTNQQLGFDQPHQREGLFGFGYDQLSVCVVELGDNF
ncbi:MAG: hypothetical protein P8M73_02275 [Luminiphilus sp.]|nr:hypothetical protein [Luminiphilus sp.]